MLTLIGVSAAFGAVALGVSAPGADPDSASGSIDVASVRAEEVPTTLAPREQAAPDTSVPRLRPAPTTVAPPTTLPLSPLAAELPPRMSALPPPPRAAVDPVALTIEPLGVGGAPVRGVGIDPDGQLEVPGEREVGWYRLGQRPGEPGATVLAAHVSWNRRSGVFETLPLAEPGMLVQVGLSDGSTRTYQVIERVQYPKGALPYERIWTRGGPETLVLITCGGEFNPDIRRYKDNIVVFAVPVA